MSDEYFGYTAGGNRRLADSRQAARETGENITYYPEPEAGGYIQPTVDWDHPRLPPDQRANQIQLQSSNDNIEKIYRRIMAQNGDALNQLGNQWHRVRLVLEDVAGRVLKSAQALKGGGDGRGWTGAGADAFLMRGPGATLKSITDWTDAATANSSGAFALAGVIFRRQDEMRQLYDRYKREMVSFVEDFETQALMGLTAAEQEEARSSARYGDQLVTEMRQFQDRFSREAQRLQFQTATEYWQVLSGELGGGRTRRYEGPTDAVQHSPEFIGRHLAGGLPRVPMTNAPSAVGAPNIDTSTVRQMPEQAPRIGDQFANRLHLLHPPDITATRNVPYALTPPLPPGQGPGGLGSLNPGHRVSAPKAPPGLTSPWGTGGGPGTSPAVFKPKPIPASGPSPSPGQPPASSQPPRMGANQATAGQVLRSAAGDEQLGSRGLPPAAPTPPRGLPGGPAAGTASGAPPSAPPGPPRRRRGADGSAEQFGRASASASAPVLRPSGSAPLPGLPMRPPENAHGRAVSPVLGRPRPSTDPGSLPAPAARSRVDRFPVNTPPTAVPVLGRSARPTSDTAPPPAASDGILRASRKETRHGGDGSLGSRRLDIDPERSRIDTQFERIRGLLDGEAAWTVQTPGGGVLDRAPAHQVTPGTEPPPALGR